MVGSLAGRRVLITGASSGIGAAVADAVVEAGGQVALLARRVDRLAELADRLGAAATALKCDITDEAAVPDAVEEAAERLGGLDGLINAAGLFTPGPVADTDPASWRAMFEVNVLGLLNITKAAVPHLRAGQAPAVINLSSMSGRRVAHAKGGIYAATKFAVHALSEGLRLELAPARIRVTTLSPGMVDTDITAGWPDTADSREFRERLRTDGLRPEVVANAVVHVLSMPPEVNVVEYAVMSITQ